MPSIRQQKAFGSVQTLINGQTVADGEQETSAAQDNNEPGFSGGWFTISYDGSGAGDGVVELTIQLSMDGGSTWTSIGSMSSAHPGPGGSTENRPVRMDDLPANWRAAVANSSGSDLTNVTVKFQPDGS